MTCGVPQGSLSAHVTSTADYIIHQAESLQFTNVIRRLQQISFYFCHVKHGVLEWTALRRPWFECKWCRYDWAEIHPTMAHKGASAPLHLILLVQSLAKITRRKKTPPVRTVRLCFAQDMHGEWKWGPWCADLLSVHIIPQATKHWLNKPTNLREIHPSEAQVTWTEQNLTMNLLTIKNKTNSNKKNNKLSHQGRQHSGSLIYNAGRLIPLCVALNLSNPLNSNMQAQT